MNRLCSRQVCQVAVEKLALVRVSSGEGAKSEFGYRLSSG